MCGSGEGYRINVTVYNSNITGQCTHMKLSRLMLLVDVSCQSALLDNTTRLS